MASRPGPCACARVETRLTLEVTGTTPSPTPSPTPYKDSSSSADADDAESTPPKRTRKPRTPPRRFDEFWAAYPRRVGKIAAERAYAKALATGHDPALIIEGARFYAMERKLQDPQYTKHPVTWLNGGCWLDEPDPGYKPPVITGPSEAATAMPPPVAAVLAQQAGYGTEPPPQMPPDPWPDLDFGRMPE